MRRMIGMIRRRRKKKGGGKKRRRGRSFAFWKKGPGPGPGQGLARAGVAGQAFDCGLKGGIDDFYIDPYW